MIPENRALYSKVNKKWKIGECKARYNACISSCPECNWDWYHGDSNSTDRQIEAFRGFAKLEGKYAVIVYECPKCFEKWWHHVSNDYLETMEILLGFRKETK